MFGSKLLPKVETPETLSSVTFAYPPITLVAVSAFPNICPTNVVAYISLNLFNVFPIS